MSVESMIARLTPASIAADATILEPRALVSKAAAGFISHAGTCFNAAAWTTRSTPRMARSTTSDSVTLPITVLTRSSLSAARISDCLSSSREKQTTFVAPLARAWRTKALPKLPVAPDTKIERLASGFTSSAHTETKKARDNSPLQRNHCGPCISPFTRYPSAHLDFYYALNLISFGGSGYTTSKCNHCL